MSILLAIRDGDLKTVRKTLRKHPDQLEVEDVNDNNLIQYAILKEQYQIVEYLLKNHKEIYLDNKNFHGHTALHMVCYLGRNIEYAEQLIAAGADVNVQSKSGKIALHYISEYKINSIEKAKLLINNGSSKNLCDNENRSPLFYTLELFDLNAASILLENGIKVCDESIKLLNKYSHGTHYETRISAEKLLKKCSGDKSPYNNKRKYESHLEMVSNKRSQIDGPTFNIYNL